MLYIGSIASAGLATVRSYGDKVYPGQYGHRGKGYPAGFSGGTDFPDVQGRCVKKGWGKYLKEEPTFVDTHVNWYDLAINGKLYATCMLLECSP